MGLRVAFVVLVALGGCASRTFAPAVVPTYRYLETQTGARDALTVRVPATMRVFAPLRFSIVPEAGQVLGLDQILLGGHLGLDFDFGHFLGIESDHAQWIPTDSVLILRLSVSLSLLTVLWPADAPGWEHSAVLRVGPSADLHAGVRISNDVAIVLQGGLTMLQRVADQTQMSYTLGLALEWEICRTAQLPEQLGQPQGPC